MASSIVIAAIIFGLLKLYLKITTGVCKCNSNLKGKTAIVTGANTGIGYETAKRLAQCGARVILACRDMNKAKYAAETIIKEIGEADVQCYKLDLSSLESVRSFSKEFHENEKRLDILINNAGIAGVRNKITNDGLQIIMQVNHFAPLLLTILLLGLLKKFTPSRIVFVSSLAHNFEKLDVEDLNWTKETEYKDFTCYANSKLCNILITKEFAKRLAGTGVTVNCLHPGVVLTNVFRKIPQRLQVIILWVIRIFFKNPEEGAQTTLHLALSNECSNHSGYYYADCKKASESKKAKDPLLARRIFEKSLNFLGITEEELSLKL